MPKLSKIKKQSDKTTCCICLKHRLKHKMICLDTCKHYFCRSCITKWSKRENTCPQCRVRFNKIGDHEVEDRNQREEELSDELRDYIKELTVRFICSRLFRTLLLIGCQQNKRACKEMVMIIDLGLEQIENMDFVHNMEQRHRDMFDNAKTEIHKLYEYI